jgi:immunity protein, SdpI family
MNDMTGLANRRFLIVVAAAYVASIVAYPNLPGPYTPSIARPLIAFLLPTTAALIYLLARRVWMRDPVRDGDEAFEPTYDAIFFSVVLFIVALHVMVIGTLTGMVPAHRTGLLRSTMVLFGLLMLRIGNLLPRTRPNLVFGIRTPRTLTNRDFWMRLHRIAGYVTVVLGSVVVVSGTFLSHQRIDNVLAPAALAAAAVLVVSYQKYSRA